MYDSSKVAFSWGGVAAVGIADGEWITWEFPNDEATTYVGTRGEGSNVKSPDQRCTITVTLQSDSPTNLAWDLLRKADAEVPALCRDRSSTAIVAFAQKCMSTKQPAISRSRDKPVTVWTFTAPRGDAQQLGLGA
jgi:hypothetical protein